VREVPVSEEFKDKIKSIGFSTKRGTSVRKPVVNEETGTPGGYHVEHWDGSQDAHVVPQTVTTKLVLRGEE
jgi:hypothetical protein